MAVRKTDRRTRRTRKRLQDALIALIQQKSYNKITVQNILDQADAGRSTFYNHFVDKDALLVSCFDDLAEDLHLRIEHTGESRHLLHSQAYFLHAQERKEMYQAMAGSGCMEIVMETGRRHMEEGIQQHFAAMGIEVRTLGVPLPVLVNFLTGSLLSLLNWWLDEGMPNTPAEMANMYEQLVMPGFLQSLA